MKKSSVVNASTCRAKVSFELKTEDAELEAAAHLLFKLDGRNSSLKMNILNPFGVKEAIVHIDSEQRQWTYRGETQSLDRVKVFDRWYEDDWWQQLAFSMNLASGDTEAMFVDRKQNLRLYETDERSIVCLKRKNRICKIMDPKLQGSFNFSFLECR